MKYGQHQDLMSDERVLAFPRQLAPRANSCTLNNCYYFSYHHGHQPRPHSVLHWTNWASDNVITMQPHAMRTPHSYKHVPGDFQIFEYLGGPTAALVLR